MDKSHNNRENHEPTEILINNGKNANCNNAICKCDENCRNNTGIAKCYVKGKSTQFECPWKG